MQILKVYFIIITALLFQHRGFSQTIDSLRLAYNNGTLYRYGGYFMKGNEPLTFKDLEHEFDFSELASVSYEKAKKSRATAKILSYVSIAANLAVFTFIVNNNKNGAYVSIGVQFALLSASGSYRRQSSQHLDRAIWQRNKDYLFPPPK